MPVERIKKDFKDLSMSFQASPLNYDLLAIKNETAIARSIRNLVFTLRGEKFFNEELGSGISKVLFENIDDISASVLRAEITNVINQYEPRVNLIRVDVSVDYENNGFYATITYNIIGIDVLPQQLAFALQPTR